MSEAPSFILACDIGGTHITSAIVNTHNWEILSYTLTRAHINSSSDAKSIFQGWAGNIKSSLDKFDGIIKHIGIAMPGPFDYEGGISLMKNQDRKSTRLNSSHVKISYAVFCLKKKKK